MNVLNAKVAVITGGASGIGKACAEVFAQRGARVVLSDLPDSDGESVAAAIRDKDGEAIFVPCDVSSPEQVNDLMERAVQEFGELHIGVNNAGISGDFEPTADTSLEEWQRVLDINLTGAFLCMKAQIPAMLEAGGGSITNVSSVAGRVGFPGASAYTASKHGMVGLTKSASIEYSSQGIRVNAVGPAVIETPMVGDMLADDETREGLLAAHTIGRFGTPEEVAKFIAFLASDDASFITGGYHAIDGGYLSQ